MSNPSNNPNSSVKDVGARFSCTHNILFFIEVVVSLGFLDRGSEIELNLDSLPSLLCPARNDRAVVRPTLGGANG